MVIIWRPWSSFQNDDHQWGYGHHFGRMLTRTLTRTLTTSLLVKFAFFFLCIFWGEFSNALAQPCRQILGQFRFLSLLAAVKDKKRTCALCGNFLLVWVGGVFLPITTTPRWYWECFDIRPWDMSILRLSVYVQNLLVVSDKPEQLIWVNKHGFWFTTPWPAHQKKPAVINRTHGLV